MFQILLAEDDENLRTLVCKNLEQNGFEVAACPDGLQAIGLFERRAFDLLVTDVMMPHMDGDALVAEIKKRNPSFPVIMLTALDTIADKRKSFGAGADDYLTKPVDFEELILRIQALFRRYRIVNQKNIAHREVALDYDAKSLTVNGRAAELTKKEFLLIYMLCASPGRIYSRTQILDEVWGADSESFERTVDVHINKVREKLEISSVEIVTVRGLGYKAVFK